MGGIKKTHGGPPELGSGIFPVEPGLGNQDTPMKDPTVPAAAIPEHVAGGRFGSNLVENDTTAQYTPGERASPGIPTHQLNSRFGGIEKLPDKSAALNPTGE